MIKYDLTRFPKQPLCYWKAHSYVGYEANVYSIILTNDKLSWAQSEFVGNQGVLGEIISYGTNYVKVIGSDQTIYLQESICFCCPPFPLDYHILRTPRPSINRGSPIFSVAQVACHPQTQSPACNTTYGEKHIVSP